jgi:hypothetical protein
VLAEVSLAATVNESEADMDLDELDETTVDVTEATTEEVTTSDAAAEAETEAEAETPAEVILLETAMADVV